MRVVEDGSDERTLWCGNISDQVTDEILYELFLQAGPLESIRRPRDPMGRPKSFAFIVYKHECSVPYALKLFSGEKLFNRALNLSARSRLPHIPVLDTHLSDFSKRSEEPRQRRRESNHMHDKKRKGRENDDGEPKSWAELNALKGKGLLANGHSRDDLLGNPIRTAESVSQNNLQCMPDFNMLLQMSQQMMMPGMLPFHGSALPQMSPMGPVLGNNMYPSMQDGMSGGKSNSPERDRRRSGYNEGRGSRREHPYQDRHQEIRHADSRRHSDNYYDHRRHERGYSSSRSSHERERRDRRSR